MLLFLHNEFCLYKPTFAHDKYCKIESMTNISQVGNTI